MVSGGSRSGAGPRPRWILVTGLPVTGKSTLARQLAARYGVALLAKDDFKEALLRNETRAVDAAHSRELSDQAFAQLFAQLRALAEQGLDAVLEGNFRAGEHESNFMTLPAMRLAQILCRCDEAERQARIAARRSDITRHPGHGDARIPRDASNDHWLTIPGERWLLDSGASAAGCDALLQRIEQWWHSSGD